MVSNPLGLKHNSKSFSWHATKPLQSIKLDRATAPYVSPEDVSTGQIFWNRESSPGHWPILCVRENHCRGKPMATGAYGHPVLVIRRKINREESGVAAAANKDILVLSLTSFGQMALSDWCMSARIECMAALPVVKAGSPVLQTQKVATSKGWVKLDGYTFLSLQSGSLYKQSYVLPDHIYAISVPQLAPYHGGPEGNDPVRLDEVSYRKLMDILGLQPDSYNSVPRTQTSEPPPKSKIHAPDSEQERHISSTVSKEDNLIPPGTNDQNNLSEEEDETTIQVVREGTSTTPLGKRQDKTYRRYFVIHRSSRWNTVEEKLAHDELRTTPLKRKASEESSSRSKRLKFAVGKTKLVRSPTKPTPYTLRLTPQRPSKRWIGNSSRLSLESFWATTDAVVWTDWKFLLPRSPVVTNGPFLAENITTTLYQTKLRVASTTVECKPNLDHPTGGAEEGSSSINKLENISAAPPFSTTSTKSSHRQTVRISTSIKPKTLEPKANKAPEKPASAFDRKNRRTNPRPKLHQRLRNVRSVTPVNNFMSFEDNLKEIEGIQSRSENMGLKVLVSIGGGRLLFVPSPAVMPAPQPVLKVVGKSKKLPRSEPVLQYVAMAWELWAACIVAVYIVILCTINLVFLVVFIYKSNFNSEVDLGN